MIFRGIRWAWHLIQEGQTKFLFMELWMRLYKQWHEFVFSIKYKLSSQLLPAPDVKLQLETKYPIAYESPDHVVPWGTGRDNSTNKKFVAHMAELIAHE